MENAHWDRLLTELSNYGRGIEAVEIDGPDLVLRMQGKAIRVTGDRDHDRTVVWTTVQRVPVDGMAAAARAALDFNSEFCASSKTTMGLFVEKGVLLLGRSTEAAELQAGEIVGEALELMQSLSAAGTFLQSAFDRRNDAHANFAAATEASALRI